MKTADFLLRKMLITDHKGAAHLLKNPVRLERKDNLFRLAHLFCRIFRIFFFNLEAFHCTLYAEICQCVARFKTKGDFLKILKEPKNALTKQYIALIEAENVSIEFSDDALEEIAEKAFAINEEMENIGARRLQTIMSKLLNDILFDIPDTIGAHSKILINKALVDEKLTGIIKNKDLSEYIL